MKFKHLVIILTAASFALSSCSKDRDNENGGTTPVTEEKETVMSFVIQTANSRALDFPAATPNTEERVIRNIAVFIYNASRVLEKAHIEIFDPGDYKSGSYTASVVTKTGRHYVYAIANIPALLYDDQYTDAFSEGGMESILQNKVIDLNSMIPGLNTMATIKTLMGQQNLTNQGGFMMMSEEPYVVDFIDNPDNNPAINHITLPVVRALSKVTVGLDTLQSIGGTISDVEYKVVNNPSRMYVLPNKLPLNNNVWISPNYYKSQQWPTPSVEEEDYLAETAHPYQSVLQPGTPAASANFTYCMENSNYIALEGNTTCALIRAKFNPESTLIVDKDGNHVGTLNGNGDFWLIAEYNDIKGVYDMYDLSKFYSEVPDSSELAGYTDAKVIFYDKGICYYPLWLKNTSASAYGESEWTVRRNHYYRVTINSVGGPGKSTDNGDGDDGGPIDPEVPLDGETTIRANIQVTPWSIVDQTGGI